MISAAAALACVLQVLGRGAETLPRIALVDVAPRQASSGVEGFVETGSGVISIVTTSEAFDTVRRTHCESGLELIKLASVIVHEEWHVRYGSDEHGAYEAQLAALMRLGVSPTSELYRGVMRSMLNILERRDVTEPTRRRSV